MLWDVLALMIWIGGSTGSSRAGHSFWRSFFWPLYLGRAAARYALRDIPTGQ